MVVEGHQFLAYEWTWFAVVTIMVFLRLYVRVNMMHDSPLRLSSWRWSDVFILLSWALRIPITVLDCFINAWDGYRVDYLAITPDDEIILRNKFNIIGQTMYCMVFISIKCAMLCLFAEFVPEVLRKVWWYIRFIAIVVVIHGAANITIFLTWCRPFHTFWDKPTPTCSPDASVVLIWFIPHIITDLMIISVPFTIISLLKNLSFPKRVVGCAMFSLGFLNIGCAFANCIAIHATLVGTEPPTASQLTALNFTSITEPPLAICIACIPPLRLLLTKTGREALFSSRRRTNTSAALSDTLVEVVQFDMESSHDTEEGSRRSLK